MEISIRGFEGKDLPQMLKIWNEIIEDGAAFPQLELLNMESGANFFGSQTFTGVAEAGGRTVGLYILHPNNVGRCGHICNASYGVAKNARGLGIGDKLVRHSLQTARDMGFRIMQFNAVVVGNTAAHKLYGKIGFKNLGTVPGGFLGKDGGYEDINLYYFNLENLE